MTAHMTQRRFTLLSNFAVLILITGLAQTPARADDASDIRAMAELIAPALAKTMTPFERAKTLRDMVHRHSVQSVSGVKNATTAEFLKPAEVFRNSLITGTRANSCQGLGFIYMSALRAYGLESRMIQMFSSRVAAQPVWSHASVDVWIDGRWIAMDPTMNVSLRDASGGLLSWPAALELARRGELVKPQTDGGRVKSAMSWGTVTKQLGYKLTDFARQYVIGMSRTTPVEVRGLNWDGKIKFLAGPDYDAGASARSSFYKILTGHEATP